MGVTGLEADDGGLANPNGDAELAAKSPESFESFMPSGAGACRGIPWCGAGLGHRYGTAIRGVELDRGTGQPEAAP